MENNQIDLKRRDYKAEPVKGEPMFGAGWPVAIAVVASIFVTAYFLDGTTQGSLIGGILGVVVYGVVMSLSATKG